MSEAAIADRRVAQTFCADDVVRQHARLDCIVCVADARHFQASLAESREAAEPVARADTILLNKIDLVDASGLASAKGAMRQAKPSARLLRGMRAGVPLDAEDHEQGHGDRRFVFQGIHMMMDTELTRPWEDGEARDSRLVFIGRHLDRDDLLQGLQHCVVEP